MSSWRFAHAGFGRSRFSKRISAYDADGVSLCRRFHRQRKEKGGKLIDKEGREGYDDAGGRNSIEAVCRSSGG